MTSNFQSSFIPKDSRAEESPRAKKTGVLGTVLAIVFFLSIAVSVGLYFYKIIVKKDISELQSKLAQAEASIDKETINNMSQFATRLNIINSIVSNHRVVSNVLNSIASSTVSNVYFKSFSFEGSSQKNMSVKMDGVASGYAAVALQENVFSKNKDFSSVTFSNLSLAEKGTVSFDVAILVNPETPIYKVALPDEVEKTIEEEIEIGELPNLDYFEEPI